MPQRLVSRSEFARVAGVSPAAVTKACKGTLAPACVDDRIDVDHPAATAYLARKGKSFPAARPIKPVKKAKARAKKLPAKKVAKSKPSAAAKKKPATKRDSSTESDLLDDLREYEHLTLGEIIQNHGTMRKFKDLLEARSKIAAIMQRELEMSEARGELVKRDKVRAYTFALIDAALRQLLTDAAKTLAHRISISARAGEPLEARVQIAKEVISDHIKALKRDAGAGIGRA